MNLVALTQGAKQLRTYVPAEPWQNVAPGAKHFHKRGSLVVPAAGTSNSIVVSYTVPFGFEAVLTHVLNVYIGAAAPIEGLATDLFYTIRVAETYPLEDFGSIITTLGSLTNGPYPIPGGARFTAGQVVEYLVSVPAGTGIATGGTNFVHCQLLGWHWPTTGGQKGE